MSPACPCVPIRRSAEGGVSVEVALQWCADAFSDNVVGFANSIRTVDGGTHLDGLRAALTRTVNSLGGCLGRGEPSSLGKPIRRSGLSNRICGSNGVFPH
jgi:hypothetical protein